MPLINQPEDTPIPPHLNRWSWGAFFLNWIWGIAHNSYIALLMFVPFVNIIMIFVLGAKGSKWAWKNGLWASEKQFQKSQRKWAIAGLCAWAFILFMLAALTYSVFGLIKSSDAYKLSLNDAITDQRVIELMGEPIKPGFFVTGSVHLSGSSGDANLSIPISGPKCSGKIITKMIKQGDWKYISLIVISDCSNETIVIINNSGRRIPNRRANGEQAA